jgi:hypothetical protein
MDMKTFIGIDPGGVKAFGWCVMDAALPALSVSRIVTGTCSGISQAIPEIERICATQPVGAGIDAPLYWARSGERKSDQKIRKAVANAGGSSSTVGHVNSLRGACLVQGVLSAVGLTEKWPQIAITESHPKALLSLWPGAVEFVRQFDFSTDHERDAALGAYAAFAFLSQWAQWVDWTEFEGSYFAPSGGKVAYWFPRI